jgi:hypothetical protein
MVVDRTPEFWVAAVPAFVVAPCMATVAAWSFSAFRSKSRGPLPFILIIAGIAATGLYCAMTYFVLSAGERLHFWLHSGFFIALDVYFAIADVLKMSRDGAAVGVLIYDTIVLLAQAFYLLFWRIEVGFQRKRYTNFIASCGYAAIILIFGRFLILGSQMYGERFFPPDVTKKKKKE